MTKKNIIQWCLVGLLGMVITHAGYADNSGTANADTQPVAGTPATVQCENPRPEICYELYAPVCGVLDTKDTCLTGSCAAEQHVTYVNDCKACADPKVTAYVPGGECT